MDDLPLKRTGRREVGQIQPTLLGSSEVTRGERMKRQHNNLLEQ